MPPRMQMQPVRRAQDSAATRRENAARLQGQVINDRFLDIAEAGLPFPLEIVTNRATDALLNDMVGVKKRKLQPPGKLPPNGGFTGAGEADETDSQGILMKNGISNPEGTFTLIDTESPERQPFKVTTPEVAISAFGSVPGSTLTTGVPNS